MNNKKFLAVLLIAFLVGVVVTVVATYIGIISMPWTVTPALAKMIPEEIPLEGITVICGQTATQPLEDSLGDLFVYETTEITVTLGGDIAGISPLTITIELWLGGEVKYSVGLTDVTPGTFGIVAVETYDIYIGYEVFGATEGTGTAIITLNYSPT